VAIDDGQKKKTLRTIGKFAAFRRDPKRFEVFRRSFMALSRRPGRLRSPDKGETMRSADKGAAFRRERRFS